MSRQLKISIFTIILLILGGIFHIALAKINSFDGPPTISNISVNKITGNTAELYAYVLPNGAETTIWMEWGESIQYSKQTQPLTSFWSEGIQVSKSIYELKPMTTYHFRVVSQNESGITYGNDTTFTTTNGFLLSIPLKTYAYDITKTSAKLYVKSKVNGFDSYFYFDGGAPLMDAFLDIGKVELGSGLGVVETTFVLTGLIPNTVYKYKIALWTSYTYLFGEEASFITSHDSSVQGLIIPIKISDNMERIHIRRFGVHSMATYCEDRKLDEWQLPPPPPYNAFDTRFLVSCLSLGTYTDIREYYSPTQIDTYKLKFQTDYERGYPVILSWHGLSDLYSGKVSLIVFGDTINMKEVNSYSIENPDVAVIRIIAQGPCPVARAPLAITGVAGLVGQKHGQLKSQINPNGLATNSWFEWGTTPEYGNTTTIQGVGNEAGYLPMEDFLFGLEGNAKYHYRVVAQNSSGTLQGEDKSFITSSALGIPLTESIPVKYSLSQNYPNPFNPTTEFEFRIADFSAEGGSASGGGFVSLKVYNLLGQEVATIVGEEMKPGSYKVAWDASQMSSGVYFYRLQSGASTGSAFTDVKKMVLMR
ncbi:MAG: T9SS type A sorting domain-containing protein [Ignavibacteriales bacterium]|nr:T9SS type A sorting domain-containing protein [Ignavibacteriales bacterium]